MKTKPTKSAKPRSNAKETAPEPKPKKLGNPNWVKGKPAPTAAPLFTKDRQPSAESKQIGRQKQLAGQRLAQEILKQQFKGAIGSDIRKRMEEYYGLGKNEKITVEMMLHFRQIEKAVGKADTSAYRAILDRAHGMPKQVSELQFSEGAVVKIGGKKLE